MIRRIVLPAAALLLSVTAAIAAPTYSFDLGGTSSTFTTPGSITANGLTTTFSGDSFYIGPTAGLFSTLPAEGLYSSNPLTGATLTLTFSQPVSAVDIAFGLVDIFSTGGGDSVAYTTDTGPNGSIAATEQNGDFYPSANAVIGNGTSFSRLTLTGPYQLIIGVTDVPEPATFALVASALGGLIVARRRF